LRWPQLLRRTLQLGLVLFVVYTAFGSTWRNYKVAHNHRRLVALIEGDFWGKLYAANEDALSVLGEPYEKSLDFLGMPWASRFFGVDSSDPTLVVSQVVTTGSLSLSLLLSMAVPLLLAVLLGKVFCSHLCPMRLLFELMEGTRRGLRKLGLPMPEVRSRTRLGGWVWLGGLFAATLAGTSVWLLILPYVSLSTGIFLYISAGTVSAVFAVVAFWATVELLFAPGYFCHNVCPTGFLLENLGRFSLLRLRKRPETCPASCTLCQKACPYGLSPKEETHRPACDNCGRCVPACPSAKLSRRLSLPIVTGLLVWLVPTFASAHHNKGLPHYGYFDNYPQVPTEEYIDIQGKWEFGATIFNFQGLDRRTADTPNDVKIYCYLYDVEADRAYTSDVDFEIRHDGMVVSSFHRSVVDEEAVYSTRETLPETGDYELVARVGGTEVVLPFYIELASDRINWLLIAAILIPAGIVFALAYVGRQRRLRSRRPSRRTAGAVLVLLALSAAPALPAFAANEPAERDQAGASTSDLDRVCPHCGMLDCTMDHTQTPDGAAVMLMSGIPTWLFLLGIAGILVFTFVGVERFAPTVGAGFRKNLIKDRRRYKWVRSRWFQAGPQLVMVGLLAFLIYVGLFGSRISNLTPVAVWTIWWAGLIFTVLFFASSWCFVCPWDGIANLVSRLRVAAKVEPLSMGLHFPAWLKNVYPAIALFVVLTWLELGFGVTTDPRTTAYMGLAMVGGAALFALLFDGKRFCAHLCPVGRICGIYSTFSPIEIRARNPKTCNTCTTEDCLNGNERGYACPTGISLKVINSSSMCTMCTECVKSCNRQNVAINLRPLGADLSNLRQPRMDEAWLALFLLALTLFHGLSMTPAWESFRPGDSSILKWMAVNLGTPRTLNFTVSMAAAVAVPMVVYWFCCRIGAMVAGPQHKAKELFVHYAYSLLPVALFYHLAHNLMHILGEGGHIVSLASDPMGTGANYFGTADMKLGHLVSESLTWQLQVGLILIGHIYGIIVAHRISRKLYDDKAAATRSLIPMLAMMVLISVGGLFLMHLDMNMRTGRM